MGTATYEGNLPHFQEPLQLEVAGRADMRGEGYHEQVFGWIQRKINEIYPERRNERYNETSTYQNDQTNEDQIDEKVTRGLNLGDSSSRELP